MTGTGRRYRWQRGIAWLAAWWFSTLACGADHGVVLLYHHIDESTPASTSVTPDRFREHLDHLQDGGFVVMPLVVMLDALSSDRPVPDNAVAITFDDANRSIHAVAAPELAIRSMPYTVFIATDAVDQGHAPIMSWAQLNELDRSFADFGAHSITHAHLVERRNGESPSAWRTRVAQEIGGSVKRIEEALDTEVRTFAYPYGEYDAELSQVVAATGLYGLAQQSGAFGPGVPPEQVPRFAMSTGYDSIERLEQAIRSRPLPVAAPPVRAQLVASGTHPRALDLVVQPAPFRRESLACFGGGPLPIERTAEALRVVVPPLKPGRNKINCTAPATGARGEYFWYSHLWIVTDAAGRWLTY